MSVTGEATTEPKPDATPKAIAVDPIKLCRRVAYFGSVAFTPSLFLMLVHGHSRPWTCMLGVTLLMGIGLVTIRNGFDAFAELLTRLGEIQNSSIRLEQKLDETLRALAATPTASPAHDQKIERLAEIRHAIRDQSWADAADLIRDFAEAHPGDLEPVRAAEELANAKETVRVELLEKLEAARGVNDPDRVLQLRDLAKPLLDHDPLQELDRSLAKWFMSLIQRRLRTGKVQADVAILAGKVAERLDETAEGASLRASLPTLRRAAGLCPKCGQPYNGLADACPACLTGTVAKPEQTPWTEPEPVADEDEIGYVSDDSEENDGFPEFLIPPT